MTFASDANAIYVDGQPVPKGGVRGLWAAIDGLSENIGKIFPNRAAAVNAGQAKLPVAYGMISTLEGQVLKIRAHNNSTNDPLFGTAPFWGVVFEINSMGGPSLLSSVSGSNTITAQLPSGAVLVDGAVLLWKPVASNTGNVLLNVDGPNRQVRRADDSQLSPGDLNTSRYVMSVYIGTIHYVIGWLPSEIGKAVLDSMNSFIDINENTQSAQRNLDVYTLAGQNLAINRGSGSGVITNLPPSIGTTSPSGSVWNTREGSLVVQNFRHRDSGRNWYRRWNGSSWGEWVEIEPNRILPSLIPQLLHTAYNGAVVGADQRGLRAEVIAASGLYLSSADHPVGPVESVTTRGSWGLVLTKSGTSTPQRTAAGYVFDGSGYIQNASANPIVKEPFRRYDVYMSFTIFDATLSGSEPFRLSQAAGTRLACAAIPHPAGYYRLRFDLPGGVTFIDSTMGYPEGDRARFAISIDYAAGEAQITQSGRINIVPFTPPGTGNMQVSRVELGKNCDMAMTEFLAIGRNR